MQVSAATQLEEYKKKLVTEVFINTADEDYVMARFLFLNQLYRQFFWSAAQSLEKYFKAVLLVQGCSARGYKHDLVKLYADVNRCVGGAIPDNLSPPTQVKLFSDASWGNLWGDSSTEKYLCHICENGDPSNRYDYFGIEQDFGDLYKLDQVVLALRSVLINRVGIAQFIIPAGAGDSIRTFAYENNFSFAPVGFVHQELRLKSSTTVSSLKILYKNPIQNSTVLRRWVKDNISIREDEITRLRKR